MAYAVVHSTVSGMLRRAIADDEGLVSVETIDGVTAVVCQHSNAPPSIHPLLPGESAFTVDGVADNPYQWKRRIWNKTGIYPPELRCALVEDGTVTGVIAADIAVDDPPDERLMVDCYAPEIGVGYSYDEGTHLFSSPEGLIPPHTPGNDTDTPIVVPPAVVPRP